MSAFISGSVLELKSYLAAVRHELCKIRKEVMCNKNKEDYFMCKIRFLKGYEQQLIDTLDGKAVHGLV